MASAATASTPDTLSVVFIGFLPCLCFPRLCLSPGAADRQVAVLPAVFAAIAARQSHGLHV
jgi:hypothetical protein